MTEVIFRKRKRAFVAIDQEGLDLLASIKDEHDVRLEVTKPRNPKHHRLFFAILKFCLIHAVDPEENSRFDNIEQVKTAIKVATGEVDTYIDADTGKTFFIVRSISFSAMDQTRFAAFFDRAVHVIANRWMPAGTTEESVRAEIMAMIEPHDTHAPPTAPADEPAFADCQD